MYYARFLPQMKRVIEACEKTRQYTHWAENKYFGEVDAMILFGMFRLAGAEQYIEIGSGYSTVTARWAIEHFQTETHVTCIDPEPRISVSLAADELRRRPLKAEDANWICETLQPGDILFIDGSHQLAEGSDVQIFWNCIYPTLSPGVFVHLHDIFLPEPYPKAWADRNYNEQYVLLTALQIAPDKFDILFAGGYLSTLPGFGNKGKSFWFTKTE